MFNFPQNSDADESRPVATGPDQARQAPTEDDYLSLKEALGIFIARGRPVTERTLQRYCDKHHLDGQKRITGEGEKWFVRRSSVERRIAELEEFDRLRVSRQAATSRDVSAPVAEENQGVNDDDKARHDSAPDLSQPVIPAQPSPATGDDLSRQAATGHDVSRPDETVQPHAASGFSEKERELYERLLAQYENEISALRADKEALTGDKLALVKMLETKDRQIDHFFSSERDTKTLLGTLQNLMHSIWPSKQKELGERYVPAHDALESGLDRERRDGFGS